MTALKPLATSLNISRSLAICRFRSAISFSGLIVIVVTTVVFLRNTALIVHVLKRGLEKVIIVSGHGLVHELCRSLIPPHLLQGLPDRSEDHEGVSVEACQLAGGFGLGRILQMFKRHTFLSL